ncbi:hypothetical protein A9Q91_04060 [Candidatus Gracilibacteria bacterium 28_42_T64]|nr:hypothetical protein A9Q91_04060 [Candidatus Gracilibacteria bacterium 28_42_T64]
MLRVFLVLLLFSSNLMAANTCKSISVPLISTLGNIEYKRNVLWKEGFVYMENPSSPKDSAKVNIKKINKMSMNVTVQKFGQNDIKLNDKYLKTAFYSIGTSFILIEIQGNAVSITTNDKVMSDIVKFDKITLPIDITYDPKLCTSDVKIGYRVET